MYERLSFTKDQKQARLLPTGSECIVGNPEVIQRAAGDQYREVGLWNVMMGTVEEFHRLLPRSEVRQVPAGVLAGIANRSGNDLPRRMIDEILSLNAQAVEVLARWLAQIPGFLPFAVAQDSRGSTV